MVELKGGDRLERYLRELNAKITKAGAVDVGLLEGSVDSQGVSNPLKAALNEFGVPSRNQPPRPFFRRTIAARADAWGQNLGTALVKTGYDVKRALALTGEGMVGDVQQGINELLSPPLAQSTIDAKGFDKPLIDSGDMLRSVDKQVR